MWNCRTIQPDDSLYLSGRYGARAVEALFFDGSEERLRLGMRELLNDNQLRSLQIALRVFEERLRQADAILQDVPADGILYHSVMPLTPERRAEAGRLIHAALVEVTALAETLSLESEAEDVSATIRAMMDESWADLLDARAAALRRYGAVDPDLAAALDPPVEHLATIALALSALMKTDPRSPSDVPAHPRRSQLVQEGKQ